MPDNLQGQRASHPSPLGRPPVAAREFVQTYMGQDKGLDFERISRMAVVYTPVFDVRETVDDYEYLADMPGLEEADVDVEVCGDSLIIAGERKQETEEKGLYYYALERPFGT